MSATAILVQLRMKSWMGEKTDRKATQLTNEIFKAHDSGRFKKDLVNRKYLKPVVTAMRRIRNFHRENTLAAEHGIAVLPTTNYLHYVTEINPLIDSFNEAKDKFIQELESYKQEAQDRLKELFNPAEYPDSPNFQVSVNFLPVPEDDRWKHKLAIQDDGVTEMLNEAVDDLKSRLIEAATSWHEKLSGDTIIREKTLTSCLELTRKAKQLNFTNDPEIERLANSIYNTLNPYTAEDIREDPHLRARLAEQLHELFN